MSSKSNRAPINPETEVTKEDIARMAGCSIFKVGFVTMREKWGFPKSSRSGPKGKILFNRAEVTDWLKDNDLKNFVFLAEDRAPLVTHKKDQATPDSAAFAKLHIGARPKKFSRTGTSYRVHVKEQHGYEKPHPQLSRHSNSADHRLLMNY
jgi:hypothetical protein